MPELVPTWQRLVELAGGDTLAAQMLTLYNPPPFMTGCSQAVHLGGERALVRNYDYSPELFEGVVFGSSFAGRRVVGTSDCLWGLVDGMNESGEGGTGARGVRRGDGCRQYGQRHRALVAAVFVDQMDFADANLLIDARAVLAGGLLGSHRATNGSKLLCCCDDPVNDRRPILCRSRTGSLEDWDKPARSQRQDGYPALVCGRWLQICQTGRARVTSA
jgi:hypothetical protein